VRSLKVGTMILSSGAGRAAAIGCGGFAAEVNGIMSSMPVCNNAIALANAMHSCL
jgi:hypothetical protein